MCGIIGISARGHVAANLYEGLIQLQHRGQDAAGMVTFDGHFQVAQGQGYMREAFTEASLSGSRETWGSATRGTPPLARRALRGTRSRFSPTLLTALRSCTTVRSSTTRICARSYG